MPDALALLSCAAVALATSLAVHFALLHYERDRQQHQQQRQQKGQQEHATPTPPPPLVDLRSLPPDRVPASLRVDAFVSPAHQAAFAHAALFRGCAHVFAALDAIRPYATRFFEERAWLPAADAHVTVLRTSMRRAPDGRCLADDADDARSQWRLPECVDPAADTEVLLFPGVDPLTFAPDKIVNLPAGPSSSRKQLIVLPGAVVLGGTFDVSDGSVYVGRNVRIEPNVVVKGPTILGDGSTLRSGAYLRGDVITGQGVVLRGELKNALVLDHAELCHPGYCGDSICGVRSHLGNQVTTANLSLFAGAGNLTIDVDGTRYDTGRRKVGVVLGDHSQLGCSAVTDPCTLLLPNTVAYPLARLHKGVYGPDQVIKNKPMERGVLEIAPLRPAG